MIKPQKPLMLAYIIFLIICAIYYVVSDVYNLEFVAWQRIIIAATIASYFFSVNSLIKLAVKYENDNISQLTKDKVLLGGMLNKIRKLYDNDMKIRPYLIDIENQISGDVVQIEKSIKKLNKYNSFVFVIDVLAYLTFFAILSFESISNYFINLQEFLTLIAFILIIVVEYIESTLLSHLSGLRKEIEKNNLNTLDKLEEYIDGQT